MARRAIHGGDLVLALSRWEKVGAFGTWRRRGEKDFVAVRPRRRAVVVHLRDAPFRRLWVSAEDPEAVVSSPRPSA